MLDVACQQDVSLCGISVHARKLMVYSVANFRQFLRNKKQMHKQNFKRLSIML